MVLKYLFSFVLLFSACGELKEEVSLQQKEPLFISLVKSEGFSPRAEKKLINSYNNFKSVFDAPLETLTKEERKRRKVKAKLIVNEDYEYELYQKELPKRDIHEVYEKYKFLGDVAIKDAKSVQNPIVIRAIIDTYKDFGRLYISKELNAKGKPKKEVFKSAKKPWSGHWYPFSQDTLYKDENSPLGKFDALVKAAKGVSSCSADRQREYSKGLGDTAWNGLCDAWSFASILTEEPLKGINLFGVHFDVWHQKALLTFSHLKYPKTIYGLSSTGNFVTDGGYQDINPEAFHNVVYNIIGKEKRAIMVDTMPGTQIWNAPLYMYRYIVEQDPHNENAFLVTARPKFVKHRSEESNKPTDDIKDIANKIFTYRFYVNKEKEKDGKYLVLAGEWTNESIKMHPDNIKVPHIKVSGEKYPHFSANEDFNKNIDLLKLFN